jgi:hypothetical protein
VPDPVVRAAWLLLILVVAPAAAQIATSTDSIAVQLKQADRGDSGSPLDDCLLLDLSDPPHPGAQVMDLRVTECDGHPPGTFVAGSDVAELRDTYVLVNGATPEEAHSADASGDGRYDAGDYVYLRNAPGTGFTAQAPAWTLRLTSTSQRFGGLPGGAFVRPGDADLVAFGPDAPVLPASIAWADTDGSLSLSPGDRVYLVPAPPGLPAGSLVPAGSVLLASGIPGSAGGSASPSPSASSPAAPAPTGTAGPGASTQPAGLPSAAQATRGAPAPGLATVVLSLLSVALALAARRFVFA